MAAFKVNLLRLVNRDPGTTFRPEQLCHHNYYTLREGRVEMHLVSRSDHRVRVAVREFSFADGEPVRTEHSTGTAPMSCIDKVACPSLRFPFRKSLLIVRSASLASVSSFLSIGKLRAARGRSRLKDNLVN